MTRRRKRGNVTRARATTVVAVALLALSYFVWSSIRGRPGEAGTIRRVVIPRGASVRIVAESLSRAGIIRSPRLFRWYAAFGGRDRSVKAGTYQFASTEGWSGIVDALVSGRSIVHSVMIPEGYDLRSIVPVIARMLSVPEDSVRAAATDSAWRRRLAVPAATLEGYLFPDTYAFGDGTTAREAVTRMLERFESQWRPEWDTRLQERKISRHAAVTMASLVETEARRPEERAIIAAVYWNRVKKGMKLQADPTVQYALPAHVERVLYKDLEVNSPYNTYRHAGLPPGPIASPGSASLEAAVNPAAVPYLYFVAHPDGHHEFRTTHDEHLRAKAMVKREAARLATPPKGAK